MGNIKKYNEFGKINENIKLTDKEKDFLWSKMELNKRKRNKEKETDIFKYLKGDLSIPDESEFEKVLNSLEYSMKKRIKNEESKAPKGKYEEAFNSLREKLPKNWIGVKFSRIPKK